MTSDPVATSTPPFAPARMAIAGRAQPQVDAGFVEQPDERLADTGEVDDPGGLDPQRGDAGDLGLVLAGFGGGDLLRRDAVGLGPLGEGVQRRDLFLVGGDDELPADLDAARRTARAKSTMDRLPATDMRALKDPGL